MAKSVGLLNTLISGCQFIRGIDFKFFAGGTFAIISLSTGNPAKGKKTKG